MGYAGNQPQYGIFPSDLFTGNGSNTNFTMSSVPGNDAALLVTVDGVRQHTDTYSYSANTLTFSEAPGSGAIIEVVNMGSRADVIITEGVYKKTQFTATAAQTNFTIPTGYTVGFVDVYLNGIRLVVADDYTATDGSTIILATPAANGDSVEVVAYGTFNVANALLKSGDTMSGNLVVSGTSTLMSPVAIANTTGNTFVIANTGAVTISGTTHANGSLGVGTSTPNQSIEVYNGSDNQIRVRNGAANTQSYDFGRNGSSGYMQFYGNQTGFTGYTFGGVDGTRMTIDSSGRVITPNQPAFLATRSSSYTLSNNTTTTKVLLDTVIYDNAGGFNTSTNTYTAPVAGRYFITWSLSVTGFAANQVYISAILYRNGAFYADALQNNKTSDGSTYTGISGSLVVNLAAGDTLSLWQNFTTGSILLNHDGYRTRLTGYLIG